MIANPNRITEKMKTLLLLAILCVASFTRAGTITNIVLVTVQGTRVAKTIPLQTGQTAKVIHVGGQIAVEMSDFIDGIRISRAGNINTIFYGPTLIEMAVSPEYQNGYSALVTLEIDPPGPVAPPVLNIPSNAVVIPADSAGPVQVLLESSVDLITWNSALPGTYGTSSTNRFFRVRAVR
jgi:hypothetical protein